MTISELLDCYGQSMSIRLRNSLIGVMEQENPDIKDIDLRKYRNFGKKSIDEYNILIASIDVDISVIEYHNALEVIRKFHIQQINQIDLLKKTPSPVYEIYSSDTKIRIENITQKQILTLDEVAEYTGLSKSHLYKLTSGRKIPHYKPDGKVVYFFLDEIKEWLMQNRVSTQDEIAGKAQNYCMANKKGGKQ